MTAETKSEQAAGGSKVNWAQWTPYTTLVRKRHFFKLVKTVTEGEAQAVKEWLSAGGGATCSSNPTTVLHILLKSQPPLFAVQRVIQALGSSVVPEDAVDRQGRTPLHVAVTQNCDASVVARLTHGNGQYVSAYRALDNEKRTPLHCACMAVTSKPKNKLHNSRQGRVAFLCRPSGMDPASLNAQETVVTLMNAYPAAAHMRDIHGKTPLDYAKERGGAPAIVRLLQEQTGPTENDNQKINSNSALQCSHRTEEVTETEVTSIAAYSYNHVEHSDDMSSLGSRSFHQRYGPPKYERMIYEI